MFNLGPKCLATLTHNTKKVLITQQNKLVRLDDAHAASWLGAGKLIAVSAAEQGWYKISCVVRVDCFVPMDTGCAHIMAELQIIFL